jgi:hypothetical protein
MHGPSKVLIITLLSLAPVAESADPTASGDTARRSGPKAIESPSIITLCGNGSQGYNGDGISAKEALLSAPDDIACDPQGNIFVADHGNCRIRRIDRRTGRITTVAGTGERGYDTDIPAAKAKLQMIRGLSMDECGNLIVATDNRVLKIDTEGILTTLAGSGAPGWREDGTLRGLNKNAQPRAPDSIGDGGPALQASFLFLSHAIIGPDERLYIADSGDQRVRVVGRKGTISTFAGNGRKGFSGDGGPAEQAQFHYLAFLAFNPAGELLIADYGNDRIRKVDAAGIITTVVGGGSGPRGWRGDGGPATQARLACPMAMVFDKKSNLYFLDKNNDCIRKVDRDGIITTVVGQPTGAYSGSDLQAYFTAHPEAVIKPYGLTLDHEGNLLFTQFDIPMLRKVILTQ